MTVFDINKNSIDTSLMHLYKKKRIDLHVIFATDMGENGEKVILNTLEGDVEISVDENTYVMIGAANEVYPIPKELFDSKYQIVDGAEEYDIDVAIKGGKYSPNIVKTCRLYKDSFVYALEMEDDFKVITKDNYGAVLNGHKGDFLTCSEENPDNVYIVNKELMVKTYEYVR